LGEFSPILRLYVYIGLLFENYIPKQCTLLGYVYNAASYVFIMTKNGLGYILGDSFSNSSGHPEGKLSRPLLVSGTDVMISEIFSPKNSAKK
jgi:hypothetical protein